MDNPIWVFAGSDYYAAGGLQNLFGRFATVADAVAALAPFASERGNDINWYQVINIPACHVERHYGGGGYGTDWEDGTPVWPEGFTAAPDDSGDSVLCP